MDRAHMELLAPLILAERWEEARRAALADLAPRHPGPDRASMLALWLGSLLIDAGCRLDAAGRRQTATMQFALLPSPCRHGE
jgi:hypothetical protein